MPQEYNYTSPSLSTNGRFLACVARGADDIAFIWETNNFVISIGDSLKLLFTGNIGLDQMTGPVGISEMVSQTSGIYDFVYLLSLISLSLGVTNLLPIPALDGGKIVLLIIEGIRGKALKPETEASIQSIGFLLLLMLSLYVTYNDILRIF